jgi:ankyrin repeat protein
MSEPIPERADMRQLRTQAKEVLRSLHTGETLVDDKRLENPKLADAQRILARKYGYPSWPKMVAEIEVPALIEQFKAAVEAGDLDSVQKLLRTKAALRKRIDEPMFSFDSPAIMRAASHPQAEKLLPILVQFGANPNTRSKWWAGGFSPLDMAKGKSVDVLLELGANFDVWSAAAHGRLEILRELLDHDPNLVNARGGDGETPLHFASTPAIVNLLVERGADLEVRDVDHESTAVQYHVNHSEVLRALLQHGGMADVFTAVVLDDADLLRRLLAEDLSLIGLSVGQDPFTTKSSNGGHIYAYTLGNGKTPFHVAVERGCHKVLDELRRQATPPMRLIMAAWEEDEELVNAIIRDYPNLVNELGSLARTITDAAQAGRVRTVQILLNAGVDPNAPGMDSGTALHLACWFGYVEVVHLLVERIALDVTDSVHGSPPLGWAIHGSVWCRNPKGDYVAVVEALLKAGADPHARANLNGISMIDMAGSRNDIKEVLRQYGSQ